MLEWLAAALVVVVTLVAMPALHRHIRRSSRGKLGGFALGFGVIFANLLDPAQRQATEEIDREKGISGERSAPRVGEPYEDE